MTDTIQEHVPTVVAVAEPIDPTIPTNNVYDHYSSVHDHYSPPAAEIEFRSAACSLTMAAGRSIDIVDDVEAERTAPAAASSAPSGYNDNDEAGKYIGIAMFICIMVGLFSGCFAYVNIGSIGFYVAIACSFVAILLASSITCACGCCCGSNLNLNPKVKRWSTATLICLVIQWMLAPGIYGLIYLIDGWDTILAVVVFYIVWIIAQILYILAAVFAGIFTWGRKCKCCGGA